MPARVTTIPKLQDGDPKRIVVEAYPGVLARQLIGNRSYKQDTRKKQTSEQRTARLNLLDGIVNGRLHNRYGFGVKAQPNFAKIRAGITSTRSYVPFKQPGSGVGVDGFRAPNGVDQLEGSRMPTPYPAFPVRRRSDVSPQSLKRLKIKSATSAAS